MTPETAATLFGLLPESWAGSASPAFALLIGGLVAACIPVRIARKVVCLVAPVIGLVLWYGIQSYGNYGALTIAGFDVTTLRYDRLSSFFALVFLLAAFLNALYALSDRSPIHDVAGLLYAGAAVGAVFAGDWITLFVYWELAAITSVLLIWARNTDAANNAGLRYLFVQVLSGVLVLSGALLVARETGSFAAFREDQIGSAVLGWLNGVEGLGPMLLLAGFGIKAGFPLAHVWIQDAYPKSTAVGSVMLSAFSTKLAIYALIRGFAGYEPLVYVGVIMAVLPLVLMLIEHDIRRILAYALIVQLGFMTVGTGLGSDLSINGAAAHAFIGVLYFGALFMGAGAVLLRTGTTRLDELGGLIRSMPLTGIAVVFGALTLAAMPLFGAFVSKAMILTAAHKEGYDWVWAVLYAVAGTTALVASLKIVWFTFFGTDLGKRPEEAPFSMLLAMAVGLFLTISLAAPAALGPFVGYEAFYAFLPRADVDYHPYSYYHVIGQIQLVAGAALVFAIAIYARWLRRDSFAQVLDVDWLWRGIGFRFLKWLDAIASRLAFYSGKLFARIARTTDDQLHTVFSPRGALNKAVPNGILAVWTALLLVIALLVTLFAG